MLQKKPKPNYLNEKCTTNTYAIKLNKSIMAIEDRHAWAHKPPLSRSKYPDSGEAQLR